jgi:LysM repeat protein
MKRVFYALILALLLAGQILGPAAAQSGYICKDSYVVRFGDSLGAIARRCQMTLDELLAANPGISPSSVIYPGQVLHIVPGAKPPAIPNSYTVKSGDTLGAIAVKFDTTVKELIRVNPDILDPRFIYIGQVLRVPGDISGPRVALTADTVKPGWYIEVKAYGFPPNVDVDYRIGKVGGPYTPAKDATTDEYGNASVFVTFPYGTKVGEKWEVQVLTTEISSGAQALSAPITIIQ